MADDATDFATPAFRPDDALQRLQRELRGLGLAEREGRYERRGLAIARVVAQGAVLQAAVVTRPSRASPQWQSRTLADSAAVRDFVAELKKKLAGWGADDD